MSHPTPKRQKPNPPPTSNDNDDQPYELIYWPSIPGRGEHIRLCFEETGTPYIDTAQTSQGLDSVLSHISPSHSTSTSKPTDSSNPPPPFAPPILKHGRLTLSQTPNILLYLGPRLDLVPAPSDDPVAQYHVNALALTALDGFSNEPHDTHHPIAVELYYEDQKDEAVRKAKEYRETRLPKFMGYFERVLTANDGDWLYGANLTYADLVLFQTLDGLKFAFPKCIKRLSEGGKYERVFGLYERVKTREKIKRYLESERRLDYGDGIYRYYEELDD